MEHQMKNALIIGATGFGGLGLIEILIKHPGIRIQQLVARKDTGVPISNVFPHLRGYCDMTVDSPEEIKYDGVDLAFFSTPDRAGMAIIDPFLMRNIPVIDFSGDFRFKNEKEYEIYARNKGMEENHLYPDALKDSVYGLPEKYENLISKAKIIGNPGCFAICMLLGLLPAVEGNIIESDTIICDGKTGVSGAGKNSGEANLYPQRYENVNTYREGRHQHTVEVENIINSSGKNPKKILFIPHLVPINRGILVTIYADLTENGKKTDIMELYRNYYKEKPFVQLTEKSPNTTDVRGSNRCLIRPSIDKRTGKLFITSVIDNLLKGQAGNAVQNANIILGLDQKTGLNFPGNYP